MNSKRYVIFHPDLGVFLGEFNGLGDWSCLDASGYTHAVVFQDVDAAAYHIGSFADIADGCSVREVGVAYPDRGASPREVMEAGMPGWDPDPEPETRR